VIRVAIVAESPVLRAGLASIIGAEPEVRIVGTSGSRDEAVVVAGGTPSAHEPPPMEDVDVVIVVATHAMPLGDVLPSDGSDLDERVTGPATMVLLERTEPSVAQRAYAAGASAVLPIDAGAEELRAAVRAIASGLVVIPAGLSAELLSSTRRMSTEMSATQTGAAPLTSREREVLALLAQGFANKVIASRLGITEHTVKTHVAAVYEKLGARNRAEVLVAAARQGLVML
jgi:DNA-binding NarL/FixJ family response regulator